MITTNTISTQEIVPVSLVGDFGMELEWVEAGGAEVVRRETSIVIAPDSRGHYVVVVTGEATEAVTQQRQVHVGAGAQVQLTYILAAQGQWDWKINTVIQANAKVDHHVLVVGCHNAVWTVNDQYDFTEQNAFGRFVVQGLAIQQSAFHYTGNIVIRPGAQGTDSRLTLDGLLDASARCTMVPSLQIEANEVKAGHSGSMSQLDDEQLFYGRSRGLSAEQLRHLLIQGVVQKAVRRIDDASIRDHITEAVEPLVI